MRKPAIYRQFPAGLLLFIACLTFVSPLFADDGAVTGIGGTIKLMDEHPSISMLSERVEADLNRAEVDCLFVFQNNGPATSVQMGFPEAWGGDVDPEYAGFSHFSTWVDGEEVTAKIVYSEGERERRWRVKEVHFEENQKRTVRVQYKGGMGGTTVGISFFEYILSTGASWQGPIGEVEFIVNLGGIPDYWIMGIIPNGYEQTADSIRWHWKDLEPGRETDTSRIHLWFFPGYRHIVLNGQKLFDYDRIKFSYGRNRIVPYPSLEDGQAWVALRALADWVNGTVSWDPDSRTASLKVGEQEISFQPDNRQVLLSDLPKELSKAPCLKHNRLIIPANEVIVLLGGTARFEKETKKTYLTLDLEEKTEEE